MAETSAQYTPGSDAFKRLPDILNRFIDDPHALAEYKPGESILSRGDTSDHIHILVKGEASVVLEGENKEKVAVEKLGPGDMFGEIHFFTGIPWPSDAELVAEEHCSVFQTSAADFEKLLRSDPEFAIALIKNLVRRIMLLDRNILKTKLRRRALQSLISREDHIFPDYIIGDYVRKRVSARIEELAQSDGPVLIIGETGVGKEILAHKVFKKSHLCKEVFLQVDLIRTRGETSLFDGVPDNLQSEKELTDKQLRLFFGSEEPSPDGGIKEIPGYFELTEDGTLLVRGVEHLTPAVQMKLLEAIVTETFRRCGGVSLQKAKVRLIATTRLNPTEITLEQHPLIYALLQRSVTVPPLRTRRREIPVLVQHYLKKYSQELGRKLNKLPKETLKALVDYPWPGNDLELASTLKRAVLIAQDGVIRPKDIFTDLKKSEEKGKFDLLRFALIKRALTSPLFPGVLQSAIAPFFFIILAVLFLGPADPMRNQAALFSWAVGWPFLVIGSFLFARLWCSICPIGTISNLVKKIFSFDRPFPAFLKNRSDFLIAGVVLFIIWLETATNMRGSPMLLGLLLSVMLISAVVAAIVYERQAWCLYLCGLGGMAGLFAKTSVLELRANRNVCISQCSSNECFLGTETEAGCPFGQFGPRLQSNRLCSLCSACVKNCPYGAINLNLRMPGREIWENRHTNTGTAFLVIGMTGGLLGEMVNKIPAYNHVFLFSTESDLIRFTFLFVGALAAVNCLFFLCAGLSSRILKEPFWENYSRFGVALLPFALTAFLAFHVYYLVNLGMQLPILLSSNYGLAIFEKIIIPVPPFVTEIIQNVLILIGLIWTMAVMYKISYSGLADSKKAALGVLPYAASTVALAAAFIGTMHLYFFG